MPNVLTDLKDKAQDVWRRAPTVVTVCAIALLLLCSSCCLCSGCFLSNGDTSDQQTGPQLRTQSGTGLSTAEFEQEILDKVISKTGFYRTYGRPSRTMEIGVFTYLDYTCTDGRVRVKCRTAAFKERDEISTVAVEPQ